MIAAAAPRRPGLGTLFVAAQLVDIVFFILVLAGVEHMRMVPGMTRMNAMDLYDMPWDHSLLGAAGWAAGFALLLRLVNGRWDAGLIGGAVVLSHWLLDLLVHRPDLTLAGGPPPLGLGLWNLPWVEIPLELTITFGGLAYFIARTRAHGAAGRWLPWLLAAVLAALQAVNWLTPQPPAPVDPVPAAASITALAAYGVMAALAATVAATRTAEKRGA